MTTPNVTTPNLLVFHVSLSKIIIRTGVLSNDYFLAKSQNRPTLFDMNTLYYKEYIVFQSMLYSKTIGVLNKAARQL